MDRDVLTDAQWARIEPHCLGKPTDPGRSGKNNRLLMEAVLWIARTGGPWRDLPERFGNWSTAFRRFRGWRAADVFKRIFDALSDQPDMEWVIDVRAQVVMPPGPAAAAAHLLTPARRPRHCRSAPACPSRPMAR